MKSATKNIQSKEIFRNFPLNGRKSTNIHIYCPSEVIPELSTLLAEHKIYVDFNNLDDSYNKNHKYLLYIPKKVSSNVKEHLIQHIKRGLYVRPLIDFLEDELSFTLIELMNSDYFFYHTNFTALRNPRLWIFKRVSDIIYSIILSVFFLPISLFVMLIIKLESKGPVFYKQTRLGKFNKPFQVIKFRSMQDNAEVEGAIWACENDCRVTKVGKWMRKLRIDEVPQLVNVIKGEMSLIGPRPEREEFINELEKEIPYYRFRHAIKPGLTGWAQVNYPYGASVEDAKWKHRFDMYYINKQSFLLDLKIIFKTVKVMLFGMGR